MNKPQKPNDINVFHMIIKTAPPIKTIKAMQDMQLVTLSSDWLIRCYEK